MQEIELLSCGKLLIQKSLTIAFAESATAGKLVSEFSMIPDAGKFLKGGLVCYDAALKQSILKVPADLIETFTPESMEVTKAITLGLMDLIPADIHIGITGLTSPGGSETAEKPIGTIFIYSLLHGKTLFSERAECKGKPEEIILQTVKLTAQLLNKNIAAVL